MKAEELAKELLKNPDFDISFKYSEAMEHGTWGLRIHTVKDIEVIGYSDKVIILGGEGV